MFGKLPAADDGSSGSAMRMKFALVLLALLSFGATSSQGPFVSEHPLEKGLTREQRIALESIALQAEILHPSVLEVSRNADLLLRLPALWADFELSVAPLFAPYDDDERAALQHLMRQPGLVELLADRVTSGEGDLEAALEPYPEALRDVARAALSNHPELLLGLRAQTQGAVLAFEALIATRPPDTRDAFREVVGEPVLTSLLIEHPDVSLMLGGAAVVDGPGTLEQLALLRRQVVEKKREAQAAAERRRRALEQAQQRIAEQEAERRTERRARRLYWGRYPYWSSSCWYGDPFYDPYWSVGHRRCFYPWYRYGHRHGHWRGHRRGHRRRW
ncbi:MAG: hypothetical protein JRE70_17035 [Deltaproteobacteria bacterium]|nr:hypothetical protein [Deltaproteobacteria bacterium]